jgi:hypothetical protein
MNQGNKHAGNLIIVSNRGPNDFVWQDDRWMVRSASGGLVSMIDPLSRPSIEEESRAAYQQDQQDARIDEFARSLRRPNNS